jgi:endoglucanase
MYNTLKTLCLIPSVSGREEAIREKIKELIAPLTDENYTDNLGNLVAIKRGTAKDKKKIMLCAHMDEIGFLATCIDDNGFIRIATVGGIGFVASSHSLVVSEKGVKGVLVPESGTKASDLAADKFVIDIGARSKKEAERKVNIGDFFVAAPSLSRLTAKRVAGRPLDDRIGCAVMIEIARAYVSRSPKHDIYFTFSTQEEVGCRGAKTASFGIAPDYALIYDVTGTGDTVGAKPMECALGKGAAIKIKDSSVICHAEVVEALKSTAKKQNIPHQLEILTYGGTDTSSVQMTGLGCRAGALSIPTRYIHSGIEMLDMADAEACVALTLAFIEEI